MKPALRPTLQLIARPGPSSPSLSLTLRATFSSTPTRSLENRIYSPILTPPTFHDYLRSASASNTLLLALFTTSACAPCAHITPLLQDLITHRAPRPQDKFSALAFAEVQLDSPDTSNGNMTDVGVEYGVRSMPTLIGFGGRRSERLTERLVDVRMLSDRGRMGEWIDEAMESGDPFPAGGGSGGDGGGKGLLARLFG